MGILPLPYSARIDAINDLIDGFIKLDGGMPQAVTLANIAVSGSASDLTSGTLADVRLSSNVPLKNAANTFTAGQIFNLGTKQIKLYGVSNFMTLFHTTDGNSGVFTNGFMSIKGSQITEPFDVTIAGHTNYMFGIESDIGAVEPTIVLQTAGPFLRGYNGLNPAWFVEADGSQTIGQNNNAYLKVGRPAVGNSVTTITPGSISSVFNNEAHPRYRLTNNGFEHAIQGDFPASIVGVRFRCSAAGVASIDTNSDFSGYVQSLILNNNTATFRGSGTFNGNLIPGANATYDIGTSISMRWRNVYADSFRIGSNGLIIGQSNYSVTVPRLEIGDYVSIGPGLTSLARLFMSTLSSSTSGVWVQNVAGQTAPPIRLTNPAGVDLATINADGGATFTGLVSLNSTSGRIANTSYSQTNSLARFGSCEIQPFGINNAWVGENYYYNGSNFVRRSSGFASGVYFHNGNVQLVSAGNDVAGSVIPSGCKFKVTPSGRIASGNNVATGGDDATGATFSVDGSGNLVASGTANFGGQVRLGNTVGNYSQMYLGKSGSHSTLLSNGDVDNNFVIQMLSTSTGSLFFDVGTGGIRVRPTGTGDEVFRVSNAGLVYAGTGLSIPGSTLGIAWNGSTTDRLTLNTGPGGRFIIRLGGVDVVDIDRDSQLASSLKISAGNSTFAGQVQIGGSGGPRLNNSSGTVQFRNSADSAFAIAHVSQLRAGVNAGTEYTIEADGYISTKVSTGIAVGFSAKNSLSQWSSQVSTGGDWEVMQYAPSIFRRLWVTQVGEVYTQNQITTASAVGNQSMRIRAIASQTGNLLQFLDVNGIEIGRVTTTANMQLSGHITSAFQSLSADPTTLDISSGMSRLVKNTTSGEIRHWVNDGGTMKKSAAFT